MRILAISGWAVPPQWFKNVIGHEFPGCEIEVLYPHTDNNYTTTIEKFKQSPSDVYLGYSLGSLWLLKHHHLIPNKAIACFLAPILAWPVESSRGGKIEKGRLDYFKKWIRNHPDSNDLILEFLNTNKICLSREETDYIPEANVLIDGLDYLIRESAQPVTKNKFIYCTGQQDPYLSSDELIKEIPGLYVVENAGHHPVPLLRFLAQNPETKRLLNKQIKNCG